MPSQKKNLSSNSEKKLYLNNKTLQSHENLYLLNTKEIDARVTMQEIIEGYPFVETHKDLVNNESFELERKSLQNSPLQSRNRTLSPSMSQSTLNTKSRPTSQRKHDYNALSKAKNLQYNYEYSPLNKCYISSRIVKQLEEYQTRNVNL